MPSFVIQYRWRTPAGQFGKWARWGRYPTEAVRDEMLVTRRAKYAWSDRFEFRAV